MVVGPGIHVGMMGIGAHWRGFRVLDFLVDSVGAKLRLQRPLFKDPRLEERGTSHSFFIQVSSDDEECL